MAEVIETIILVLLVGAFLFFSMYLIVKDMREIKAERKDCQKFRHSVDESLGKLDYLEIIANKFISKDLSYVQQLRLDYSCLHCRFQEQCMADCIAEGTDEFDYLVCENFKEL